MNVEKTVSPANGYIMFAVLVLLVALTVFGLAFMHNPYFVILALADVIYARGFFIVNPNESKVLVLFGDYVGTVKKNGLFWANPFYFRRRISLRARNFDSEKIKVNDKLGNPILISVILVWKVENTYKAAFEVNDYENFVLIQTDAAVRKLAGSYPYDNFEDDEAEITLRSGLEEVNHNMEKELAERLDMAGIVVMEARIAYLAYSPEIANSMLKRQQATAIVAARYKIVEGAVGMVESALEELSRKQLIELDEERKAHMVSNLMVVLCGDRDASPVINTGTLY